MAITSRFNYQFDGVPYPPGKEIPQAVYEKHKPSLVSGVDYASMKADDLQKLADDRGLEVKGSGKDDKVLKDDLVKALSS